MTLDTAIRFVSSCGSSDETEGFCPL